MTDMANRFWSKVLRADSSECWPWTGSKDKAGRARFNFNGQNVPAGRVALMLSEGGHTLPPPTILACHHCDNPICVNPRHLYWGSKAQNARDASERGQLKTGDKHPYRINPERCARGEGKPLTAKLTEHAVREIRASALTNKSLAQVFGVTPSAISHIRARRKWAHVQ